ncbi:phage tail tube protein [Acinetobacter brisouii]|uniref:phage tail tube protein n=1 Tax=Acinetobacter brisouii TaxID=396323 RepID=UPI0035AFF316
MATSEEMIDSQGVILSFKEQSASTWEEVAEVTDLPLLTKTRDTDDVTTVKDLYEQVVAAGVIKTGELSYELLMISGSTQQKMLNQYFEDGTKLDWKIELNDTAETSYEFAATITELSPVRAKSKKNRYTFKTKPSGKVTWKEADVAIN